MFEFPLPLAVLILLACASWTFAIDCPPAELIAPCNCTQYFSLINCENVNSGTDLRRIFSQVTAEFARKSGEQPVYEQFKLVNSALKELGVDGADIFAGVAFQRISILRNKKLRRIDPNAFRSSFNTTTDLTFEDNEQLGASKEDNVALFQAINRFSALQMLHLSDSGVRFVPEHAFHLPQPALHKILMNDNRIERIGDNAFTGLDGLEVLNLDGNQISQLSTRSLEIAAEPKHADRYLQVHFRGNRLSSQSFPPGIFSHLRRRVYLDLSSNNITTVPQSVFQSFALRRSALSLYKNPIKCDCKFRWLLDQSLLYNSSNTKAPFMLRNYQCTSDKDEEQLIHEVDAADFEHCVDTPVSSANRHCIEQGLSPESEHACLTGSSGALHSFLLAQLVALAVFHLLCQ